MDFDTLWALADRARGHGRLPPDDISFVREVVPNQLGAFPNLKLPSKVRHPSGFSVAGAPVGTVLRGALLVAGQKALGRRFGGEEFYERVEQDLALRIMRSHFHNGYPKGAYCCSQCTLAVIPVLEAGAIRYFDCRELYRSVTLLVKQRKWRFAKSVDGRMVSWAMAEPESRK